MIMSALPVYSDALKREILFWKCDCGRLWNTKEQADNCPYEKTEAQLWNKIVHSKPVPRPLLLIFLCRQLCQQIVDRKKREEDFIKMRQR